MKKQGLLSKYDKSDFTIQQKAKFVFYLTISIIVAISLLIITSCYLQLSGKEFGYIYWPIVLPELIALSIFIICLFILLKGYYSFATHLLVSTAFITLWFVIWLDSSHFVTRLDTIVFITVIFNLTPLYISRYKTMLLKHILMTTYPNIKSR